MAAEIPPQGEITQRIQRIATERLRSFPHEGRIQAHPQEEVRSFLIMIRRLLEEAAQARFWDEERLSRFEADMELIHLSFMAGHALVPVQSGQPPRHANSCVFKCEDDRKACAEECDDDRLCRAVCRFLWALCITHCFVEASSIL